MEVIARIDISTPTGRKILKDLSRRRVVKIEHPLPEGIAGQKQYTVEEVFSKIEKKLNDHYGTDYKLVY